MADPTMNDLIRSAAGVPSPERRAELARIRVPAAPGPPNTPDVTTYSPDEWNKHRHSVAALQGRDWISANQALQALALDAIHARWYHRRPSDMLHVPDDE